MAALDSFWNFLSHIPWYAWFAIAIIGLGTIRQIISMNHKHRERMEMIRQGLMPGDETKRRG